MEDEYSWEGIRLGGSAIGLTLHMSSYTLHFEAVAVDSTALGYRRFSDSLLQR
jgi:hypothetical protein